jgi:TatD family-associated radical SAM protein
MFENIKAKIIFGKLLGRPDISKAYKMVGPEDSWYATIKKVHESLDEIKELLSEWDLSQFDELVFCGYGEPTERLSDLLETARLAKELCPGIKVRINTNGLSDLINKRDTTGDLAGIIDAVSISLNAKGPEEYLALCHPRFGIGSFDAILDYTRRVKEVVPDVTMSIVGGTIPRQDERPCREIAESLGVKFRIR